MIRRVEDQAGTGTDRPVAGATGRWLIGAGLALVLLWWLGALLDRSGGFAIGAWILMPLGIGVLLAGVAVGLWPLLLADAAAVRDRVYWLVGAGVAVALGALFLAEAASRPDPLDPADQHAVVEASLDALRAGRLDEEQIGREPVFPAPPVVLRADDGVHPAFPVTLVDQLLSSGAIAGTCEARDLSRCPDLAGATVVSQRGRPMDLGGYVDAQLEVVRLGPMGCRSAADSVSSSMFRFGVVRNRTGWEVGWVVTVAGGREACTKA